MIKKLLVGVGLLLSFPSALLAQRNCGTMDHLDKLELQEPGTKARLQQVDSKIAKLQSQGANQKTNGVITIPVVVHVVYRTASQNISQAQIQSQIDVLNEDFSKTNADRVNTPAAFKPLAGDMQIRFELAQRDPNGDPTTGITRTQTNSSTFGLDDAMKFTARGGHDAWNRNKYMNIWVCNLGGGLLGYAQFPGSGPANTDGVVIGYNYFGRTGTVSYPFNKGRTATHEVGHWLGLYHIWGDEPSCANDDKVADTPLQKRENYGCPTFPQTTSAGGACAAGSPGSMFMNYMDYVDDACMNLFTVGQVSRAQTMLQNVRPTILTSDGHLPVNIKPLDASILQIDRPNGVSCDQNITPKAILKNQGTVALTSATISYQVDNGPAQTLKWTGDLKIYEFEEITLPASTVSFGAHNLTVSVTSPNGATDNDPANDAQTINFTVIEKTAGLALPFTEGFEADAFPKQGWKLDNPDKGITWERTTLAAYEGLHSAYINNYDYEYVGEADELQMPALDLSNAVEPKLTFRLAYTATDFSAGANADTLEILASTDCGVTFKSLYKKYGRSLATITDPVGTPFFPDTSQWGIDTVLLENYIGEKNVLLKFRSKTGYENNLFIDAVRVASKAEAPQPNASLVIFPNPTTGRLTLQMPGKNNAEAKILVLNSIGQEIMNEKLTPVDGKIKLNMVGKADGIYIIHVISEGKTYKQKLVLDQTKAR
ncbi:M43 family zinc metalloprotease [Adhaeribacter terreus]|uniref:M43 family zinc metalloprotease n=1 Tax=Adhaeribacter terreus TaxID=529703 RepID=A0ABW0E530_9BACT